MIIRKTERLYMEGKQKWIKHGMFDKEVYQQKVKRTTIWLLFIPIFWYENIISSNI